MKKKVFVIIAALLVTNVHLVCQDKRMFGNGYDWEKFDLTAKWFVVYGICRSASADTLFYNQTPVDTYPRQVDTYRWRNYWILVIKKSKSKQAFNVEADKPNPFRVVEGIDEFYEDHANKNIPIFAVATLAAKRATGKIHAEDIEKELQRLRTVEWE
jgi:hypothetical protein